MAVAAALTSTSLRERWREEEEEQEEAAPVGGREWAVLAMERVREEGQGKDGIEVVKSVQ